VRLVGIVGDEPRVFREERKAPSLRLEEAEEETALEGQLFFGKALPINVVVVI